MTVWLLCDDFVMILWWLCDDSVLWWLCDDFVMILWWLCDDSVLWWLCDGVVQRNAAKTSVHKQFPKYFKRKVLIYSNIENVCGANIACDNLSLLKQSFRVKLVRALDLSVCFYVYCFCFPLCLYACMPLGRYAFQAYGAAACMRARYFISM